MSSTTNMTTTLSTVLATVADLLSTQEPAERIIPNNLIMTDSMDQPGTEVKTIDEHLHFVMSAIVGPILCLCGMAGNILSLITWCRPSMRGSTGRYLTGQAVADFGVLLLFLLCDSLQAWVPSVKNNIVYGVFYSYIGYPMMFFTMVLSIWLTVGVTVDRYILVCWISKAKRLCNEKRANLGLVLVTINTFFINFPHFLSYTPVFPEDDGHDTTNVTNGVVVNQVKVKQAYMETEFGGGQGGKFYEFWIHCIILVLVPWFTVLFMNVMIIKKINDSNKRMADKKTSQSKEKTRQSENQITRLLLTVTFSFLFFIGLQCILQCLWMQKPPGANWMLISSAYAFGKTGVVFNSSLNFPLYCMTGRRFRMELKKILGIIPTDAQLSSLMDPNSSGTGTSTTSSTTGF